LEEKGIRENTLIIFAADNGGFQPGIIGNNGPLRGGKGGIYEGGIRACAFANWPGSIPAGITIDEPFHAIDWYPTLAKLTASPLEQKLPLDGRDIWPVLTEGAKSPHEVITVPGTRRGDLAIRKGDWKLIVTVSPENGVMKEELYNLAADLGESRDLAAEQPEKRAELRAIYDRTMATAVPTAEKPGGLTDG
jgi:arylsulfatase A-like enzyme